MSRLGRCRDRTRTGTRSSRAATGGTIMSRLQCACSTSTLFSRRKRRSAGMSRLSCRRSTVIRDGRQAQLTRPLLHPLARLTGNGNVVATPRELLGKVQDVQLRPAPARKTGSDLKHGKRHGAVVPCVKKGLMTTRPAPFGARLRHAPSRTRAGTGLRSCRSSRCSENSSSTRSRPAAPRRLRRKASPASGRWPRPARRRRTAARAGRSRRPAIISGVPPRGCR